MKKLITLALIAVSFASCKGRLFPPEARAHQIVYNLPSDKWIALATTWVYIDANEHKAGDTIELKDVPFCGTWVVDEVR